MNQRNNNGVNRRTFLKSISSATVLGGLSGRILAAPPPATGPCLNLPAGLEAAPSISAVRGTEGFWRQLRRAFVLPQDYIHMNTGTTGSQPAFSLNNLGVYNRYKSADPRDWQANLAADFPDLFQHDGSASATTRRQAQVAAAYGANQDEIVLSYNTTDACNLIFAGTPWKTGDRIVTTTMEHPALSGPIAWARDHHGVDVVMVRIPSNFTADITVDEVLSWFDTELSRPLPLGAKQYLAISEIFYKNGLRMPVPELCALARSHGAYSIVDTAHGWGMLPIHCHDYGADFIAGAGHKWLCGGPGTGIFYVRRSGADLPPFAMGNFFLYGNTFAAPSANFNSRNWAPSTFVQLRGENNTPALFAMTDSLRLFEYAGIDAIHERGVALGNYLKDRIAARWGAGALWVQKNPDPRFATFLTSFNPFAARDDSASFATMNTAMNAIVSALAAESPKIYIRTITWRDGKTDTADNRIGLRISTHAMYNDAAEINHLVARLDAHIAASGLPLLA